MVGDPGLTSRRSNLARNLSRAENGVWGQLLVVEKFLTCFGASSNLVSQDRFLMLHQNTGTQGLWANNFSFRSKTENPGEELSCYWRIQFHLSIHNSFKTMTRNRSFCMKIPTLALSTRNHSESAIANISQTFWESGCAEGQNRTIGARISEAEKLIKHI